MIYPAFAFVVSLISVLPPGPSRPVFVLQHQVEWDAISKANRNLLKAHCPVKHMVAADGFVFTGFPGINVSEERLAAHFNICTQFDIYCQLCSHDPAANLSTLTSLRLL